MDYESRKDAQAGWGSVAGSVMVKSTDIVAAIARFSQVRAIILLHWLLTNVIGSFTNTNPVGNAHRVGRVPLG